jgi:hypothetical protein
VPDYSEFPTTPTAWQETQWQEARFESAQALAGQRDPRPPRRPDPVALIPGVIFTVLAILFMTGVNLPGAVFRGGGILWVALIAAGVALLARELGRTRRSR